MATLRHMNFITRNYIKQSFPHTLFLFGDNVWGRGLGGQANQMRGERNSLGVPTKWTPYTGERAYFHDDQFSRVKDFIDFPFEVAKAWLKNGGNVIVPKDGLGTGLAKLQQYAPQISRYIEMKTFGLRQHASVVIVDPDPPQSEG